MESIQEFQLIRLSKEESSICIEDSPLGEKFSNDLFLESDELSGIDFLAELDKDEKMYIEELQQITDKIDLPLYDFVTGNDISENDDFLAKTEQMLEEFDTIYDDGELELPPTQTAPEQELLMEEQQQQLSSPAEKFQQFYGFEATAQEIYVVDNSPEEKYFELLIDPEPIISSPADLVQEMEIVNEIIEAHSRSQSEYDESTSSSWSPYSTSSVCSQDEKYDEKPIRKSASMRGVTKKRTRPYNRNPDEKKSRKKEQNKNAATRYRQKKKEEVHVILGEERSLMDRNRKLSSLYKDTKREVKYLKSLLRELFQARGFI